MAIRKRSKSAPCVLIVEANPLVRLSAAAIVEAAGCIPLRAASTDDAVELLKTRRDISMVFADADAPGTFDGLALAHAVRHRWPPTHLLLVSAKRVLAEADLPQRARFFAKPYAEAVLADAIRELLAEDEEPSRASNTTSPPPHSRNSDSDQSAPGL